MAADSDMVLAVLGVQLGYVTPEDVLGAVRDLLPGGGAGLAELLESRGALEHRHRQVLERLTARAVADSGGNAARTLELLPNAARSLLAETPSRTPSRPLPAREAICDEQPGRYLNAPDPARPPQPLARSTTGSVVLKHDTVFGRDVAWKSAPQDEQLEAQLIAEARLSGQLDHPAVLPVFEVGRASSGAVYMTTQQPGPRTLSDAIGAARTIRERLALVPVVHTVVQCVAAAHGNGASHRALSSRAVSLADFGAVFVTGWAPTGDGSAARRSAHRDESLVDLKALGSMLHEVITGVPAPVMGEVTVRDAPVDLLAVARRAAQGLLTVSELSAELKAWLDGRRVTSHRYSTRQLVGRYLLRHRGLVVVLAVALVALAGLGAVTLRTTEAERERASSLAQRFIDDIAGKLQAVPGVDTLLGQVTEAALTHYQGRIDTRPRAERLRAAVSMTRLGKVSTDLARLDEAQRSLDFASAQIDALMGGPDDVDTLVAAAGVQLAQADLLLAREEHRSLAAASDRRGVALADRAMVLASNAPGAPVRGVPPEVLAPTMAAVRARIELARITDDDAEQSALIARAVELSKAALAASPDDADARELSSQTFALEAQVKRTRLDPAGAVASLVSSVASVRRAIESRPADSSLQVALIDRLTLLGAAARSIDDEALARDSLTEARTLSERVLRQQPTRVGVRQALVEIEVNLGEVEEAWRNLRTLDAQGHLGRMLEAAPALAFYTAHFDEAVRYSQHAAISDQPTAVLYRGLSLAMLGQPGDALVALRSLKDDAIASVLWARGLGEPPSTGPSVGARAVRDFVTAYDAALPITDIAPLRVAHARLIRALELSLPK
jgi:tetratricopeptide (TPR) repeat protein